MDTILVHRPLFEKAATSVAGISIAVSLLVFQNIFLPAKGVDLAYVTGVSPMVNAIKDSQKEAKALFEVEINKKYGKYDVLDVEEGVKHVRMIRYYKGRPVRLNIVEVSQNANSNLQVVPSIASTKLASRKKISTIANRENAIVAINGGYFKPMTGVPLGTLMIDQKLYTGPVYDRVAMGFFNNGYEMARIQLNASVVTNIGDLKIDNINQPRMLSVHTIVYTPDWGEYSPPSPKYGKQIVVDDGRIVQISTGPCKIPQNGFVIVGAEKNLNQILKARKISLKINTIPGWKNVNHIISGGPYLVKDGEIFVDMTAQKLASVGGRNPRTAIGYTKSGNLVLLTADGREGASIGLTLVELANLMKELGCVNAMNLDGGGSTVMYVSGKVVNRPAQQGGIPLSHALVVKKV